MCLLHPCKCCFAFRTEHTTLKSSSGNLLVTSSDCACRRNDKKPSWSAIASCISWRQAPCRFHALKWICLGEVFKQTVPSVIFVGCCAMICAVVLCSMFYHVHRQLHCGLCIQICRFLSISSSAVLELAGQQRGAVQGKGCEDVKIGAD